MTAFVGANLFQSALTGWCLMDDILRKIFHVRSEAENVRCCIGDQEKSLGTRPQVR